MVSKIIKRYPEFGFIDPADIYVVRDVWSLKHHAIASIGLIKAEYRPLFKMKHIGLILMIHECNWRRYPRETKLLILYHELLHVEQEQEDKRLEQGFKYQIHEHDLIEFYALVNAYGARWLRRKDLPNILKEHVKIEQPEEKYPKL
jgi:hypothetical protein